MKASKQYNLVTEFMRVGKQDVNITFRFLSTKVAMFREALINEEINGVNELVHSVENDDIVGVLDGLCDILYVTYGAMATYGSMLDIHSDINMFGTNRIGTGKIDTRHGASNHIKDIQSSYKKLVVSSQTGHSTGIVDALNALVLWSNEMARRWNLDLVGAFEEVHASNMSKFCSSEQHANDSITERLAEGHQLRLSEKTTTKGDEMIANYTGAIVEKVSTDNGEYFIIKRASDGKILKGTNFFEPDLSKYA